MIPKEMEQ